MNKDFYFEILNFKAGTKKYIAVYNTMRLPIELQVTLLPRAERAWIEDSTGVSIIKSRSIGSLQDVDMKEFFWIKLRSVPLCSVTNV